MSIAKQMYEGFCANPNQDTLKHLPYFRNIAALGKSPRILEIGVYDGASTSAWLSGIEDNPTGGNLISIDINPRCQSNPLVGHESWQLITENSREPKLLEYLHGRITDGIAEPFDAVFIDGDHSYEGCKADLDNYLPLVKRGGLILVHDVMPEDPAQFPGVRRAFDELVQAHGFASEIIPGSWGLGVIHV